MKTIQYHLVREQSLTILETTGGALRRGGPAALIIDWTSENSFDRLLLPPAD
jgi:hypothetical protein